MSEDEQPNINTENMQETSKKIVDVRLYVQQSFRNGQQIKEMSNSLGIPTKKIIQLLGEEYREKVFLLYESNHNYSQIAKIVGVGHSAVNELLNKNRVKHEISPQHRPEIHLLLKKGQSLPYIAQSLSLKLKDLKKFLAPDVVFDYLRGRTITELNHYYHLNKYSIQKVLKKAGIESLDSRKTYTYRLHMNTIGGRKFGKDTFYKPLGTLIKQIIDGMLLGDGNIRINHDKSADNVPTLKEYKTALRFLKNLQTLTDITQIPDLQKTIIDFNQAIRILSTFPTAVFRVGKSVLELRYVTDGLIKKFEEAKYTCKAFLSLNKIKKLINDTHVYKIYCQFETRSSVQFTQLYKYWYPHGVKHVPRDLELTPTVMLTWYIDDGTYNGSFIEFATNSFSRFDVEFLAKKIEQTIKVKTRIYKVYDHRYPNHNYWKIYITHKRNIDRFFEYLNESDKSLLNIVKQDLYWKFSSILKKHAVEDLLKTNSWLAFIYKRNFSVEEKKYFLALLKDQLEDLPIDLIHKQCIYKYLFYN